MDNLEIKKLLYLFKIIAIDLNVKDINENNLDYLFYKDKYICMLTESEKDILLKFKELNFEDIKNA